MTRTMQCNAMQSNEMHQLIIELQPTHFHFLSPIGIRSIADPPSGTRPVAEPSISVVRPECEPKSVYG
jgi:hypothetical protein